MRSAEAEHDEPAADRDNGRVTPADIEDSLRRLRGEASDAVKSKAAQWAPVIIGAAALVVVVAYLLGRRVGATRSTVVEIRRI